MFLTEAVAKTKMCALSVGERNRSAGNRRDTKCQGSDCVTYWRWADEAHAEGYCGIIGKPEFK